MGGPKGTWIGQILADTYRIDRLIGEGGMGAVYEATHLRLARRFAVKLLLPLVASNAEAVARFKREAQITSALGHPHILEVVDFNQTRDGTPYIVMELLEGEDLQARIERSGRLPVPHTLAIFDQAASALQAAHDKGIVHRDLKSKNLFLCRWGDRDDHVKVLDFGISKVLHSRSMLTGSGALLGTPAYMAPEQAEEQRDAVDHRTDIYAMGVILYETLTGALPFWAETMPSLLYKIVHSEVPPLPDVPEPVARAVERALSKRPEDRHPTMEAFRRALSPAPSDDARDAPPAQAATTRSPEPASRGLGLQTTLSATAAELRAGSARPTRRRWALVGAAAALLLAGTVVSVVVLRRPPPAPPTRAVAAAPARTADVLPRVTTPDAALADAARPTTARPPPPPERPARPRRFVRRPPVAHAGRPGALHVSAQHGGASVAATVRLDGVVVGETALRLPEVRPGRHLVEVRAPGFVPATKRVVIRSGTVAKIRFDLRKQP